MRCLIHIFIHLHSHKQVSLLVCGVTFCMEDCYNLWNSQGTEVILWKCQGEAIKLQDPMRATEENAV